MKKRILTILIAANLALIWGNSLLPGESCQGMFEDYSQVASWAVESVNAMVAAGLIEGDGARLKPNDGTNRAAFCTVLSRVSSYIKNYTAPAPKSAEFSEPVSPEADETNPGNSDVS